MSNCSEKENQELRNLCQEDENAVIQAQQIDITGRFQQNEDAETIEFYVRINFDILLEVLRNGDRYMLTNLERFDRLIHHIVEKYFAKIPFLRLDVYFKFKQGGGLESFIGFEDKEISLEKLSAFLPFVRFDSVEVYYSNDSAHTFAEKRELFHSHLKAIKGGLNNSRIYFDATIAQDNPSHFNDLSALIDYIRDEFLPICDSSRQYAFEIDFDSDDDFTSDTVRTLFASLLQMPQIRRCSNVGISPMVGDWVYLPSEIISCWLDQNSSDEVGSIKHQECNLFINSLSIPNEKEMCDLLIKKFRKAKLPSSPFTFWLSTDRGSDDAKDIEVQVITNEKTNEQLSISKYLDKVDGSETDMIEIKRTVKKKEGER